MPLRWPVTVALVGIFTSVLAAAPPDWTHPSGREMQHALDDGFATPHVEPHLVMSDAAPYARLVWRNSRNHRTQALIVTPPLRCAWEHGVLYSAYAKPKPSLAQVQSECAHLAVLYIDSDAAPHAVFQVALRRAGRRLAASASLPDAAPVTAADRNGSYYEFANLYFFALPGAWSDRITVLFTNSAGVHDHALDFSRFARDEQRLRAAR